MPRRITAPIALAFALILTLAFAAQAHRVKVFAYCDGDKIYTESSFSKSSPAQHSQIIVTTADGTEVFSGTTDDQGKCDFPIPENAQGSLTITIIAGEGHQGEWVLEESEYR
ncbi:MAG: hypothetical protein V3573_02395 [Desulfovibrionaceae bacterium]